MNTKHTPGPWKVEASGTEISAIERNIVAETNFNTINGKGTRQGTREEKANARLIAACPTLYNFVQCKAKEGDKDAKEIIDSIG